VSIKETVGGGKEGGKKPARLVGVRPLSGVTAY